MLDPPSSMALVMHNNVTNSVIITADQTRALTDSRQTLFVSAP